MGTRVTEALWWLPSCPQTGLGSAVSPTAAPRLAYKVTMSIWRGSVGGPSVGACRILGPSQKQILFIGQASR